MESERTDPASTDELRRLVEELGRTIQRTLSESSPVAQCLGRIRNEGCEVSLTLEATIGFTRTGRPATAGEPSSFEFRVERAEPPPIRMTPLDKKFLRSLKISVEDEE